MDTKNLADLYELPPVDWAFVEGRLAKGLDQAPGSGGPDRHSCWLATINPDGTPHLTGIGTEWFDGAFWFETGETTRKGRNLARDPRCSLSLSTTEFDLAVNGEAHLVTDPAVVADVARRYAENGWPARVDETGIALTAEYSAPSAGPPPWRVYRLGVQRATALQTVEPGGATRFDF